MARAAKKTFDAQEHKIGQDRPRDMPTEGDARLDPALVEPVEGPNWEEKAAALAFMNEEVEVMVHETTDKNAEMIVEVWNGGRAQRFIRGQAIFVKRKYVEVLARAKTTVYRQEHYKDDNGADAIRNIPQTALRYPFSMTHDDNPRGQAWLRKILAEG